MIQEERIEHSREGKKPSKTPSYVLYWMQQSHRAEYNHALQYAIERANSFGLPLLTVFCLVPGYAGAGRRHYRFLLEGLRETAKRLRDRGIGFSLLAEDPLTSIPAAARDAAFLVMDSGYTRFQRQWRQDILARVSAPLAVIDTDLIVPYRSASEKEEYSAATIRKKIHRQLFRFLEAPEEDSPVHDASSLSLPNALSLDTLTFVEEDLGVDAEPEPVEWIHGGRISAVQHLKDFIADGSLERFHEDRNDPSRNAVSHLSPYLHYGQISALEIALTVSKYPGPGSESFLEELIVRRELAFNYVLYNPDYDRFEGLPRWAREDLTAHEEDPRTVIYSRQQLERAETHDPYWNAAQRELLWLGKMHGYMRMYWGKKILEWSKDPRTAFDTALYLNDRYSLDGRDPNGYTGVAWCFGKHDRPWASRSVFGKVRYMNDKGLERKFDIKSYVQRVNRLTCRQENS